MTSPCHAAPLRNKGRGRFCCSTCGKYLSRRRPRHNRRGTIRRDRRGRARIWLGKGHLLANSGGWQWFGRYLLACDLGRPLRTDEHAHHLEGKRVDRPGRLEVQLASPHGRMHAATAARDARGRFAARGAAA